MWRWLINGLGGLLGMMLRHEDDSDSGDKMTPEQHKQLSGYAEQLVELAKRHSQK